MIISPVVGADDGYTNVTGFHLTAAEQFTFDRELAQLAHHKAVLDVEYGPSSSRARQFCSSVTAQGISGLIKNLALFARSWRPCASPVG